MNNAMVVNQTIDSRKVAEMIEKNHKNLLRDIRKYVGYFTELKIEPSDFFINSEYKDSTGRLLESYLITKKGCEFIAHKMTGQKGTVFTAKYINLFHEMEEQLSLPMVSIIESQPEQKQPISTVNSAAKMIMKVMDENKATPADKLKVIRELYHQAGIDVPEIGLQSPKLTREEKELFLREQFEDLKVVFKDASRAQVEEELKEILAMDVNDRVKKAFSAMLSAVACGQDLLLQ